MPEGLTQAPIPTGVPEGPDGRRVLALTGTPGTGKTTVAERLPASISVVDAGELAEQVDAVEGHDQARGSAIVDERLLRERGRDRLPSGETVVEGVLAHYCDPDLVVILRCHPTQLGDRLAQRGWPQAKIEENVLAETLDAIVAEVAAFADAPAVEIDTSGSEPDAIAERIVAFFTDEGLAEDAARPIGTVDWTGTLLGEDPR